MRENYDAIVLGSGVGGCCMAALLAHRGQRVLLAEKRRYLGGRFSTVERDGFRCATGGLAVPVGRNLEEVCAAVGIESGVKPSRSVGIWLDGTLYDAQRGFTRRIINEVAESEAEAQEVIKAINDAMRGAGPDNAISFRSWLERYTSNPRIHGMFQATIASLLTVNSNELPAGEYFEVMRVISPLTFGFIEGGSIALWQRMADLVEAAGGTVLTGTAAHRIHVDGGRVGGAVLRNRGNTVDVRAPLVVSNLGPVATAALAGDEALDDEYRQALGRVTPTAILWLHFSSEERLFDFSAISVGCSRRVNMIDAPSFEAEGVAPPGQHLYTVGAAPLNSLDPGDIRGEFAAVMADLEDIVPDFERRCRVLTRSCYRGQWPGFRTVPGSRPTHRTPVAGLFNVGDGVSPPGYEGSMGAAKSAQEVFREVSDGP